ncbi:MAG: hypothetical protein AAF998_22305 [Bacteroidota bacterium]
MNNPITINNDPYPHPAMEFEGLVKEALEVLHATSGNRWTDFNQHDPGLTLLEQLSYVLTDLSYRINYDIEDHLASRGGAGQKALARPADILPTRPVTLRDFRKLVLDIPGVRNAWIEPASFPVTKVFYNAQRKRIDLINSEASEQIKLKGLYRAFIDLADPDAIEVLDTVQQVLMQNRNLGEDFLEVLPLPAQPVIIDVDVEVGRVEDLQTLTDTIFDRIAQFISPEITFFTLQQMRGRGLRIDEIFDGPPLRHGFIDDAELDDFQRKSELRSSDLIQVLMDIEGINAVRRISMMTKGTPPERWVLKLDDRKSPRLDRKDSRLRIFRDNLEAGTFLPAATPPPPVPRPELREWQRDLVQELRRDRHPEIYSSFQYHFPATYGLGADVLSHSVGNRRRAQVQQFRGFLLLFEQILANYFRQTAHVGELFSFEGNGIRTQFSQSLLEVVPGALSLLTPDLPIHRLVQADHQLHASVIPPMPRVGEVVELRRDGAVLGEYVVQGVDDQGFFIDLDRSLLGRGGALTWRSTPESYATWLANLTEDVPAARVRKNRLLNHLLARFSEDLSEYTLLLNRLETDSPGPLQRAIDDKLAYLRAYMPISRTRAGAFDYHRDHSDPENSPGYLKRVAGKLGFRNYGQRDLTGASMSWMRQHWIAEQRAIDAMIPLLDQPSNYRYNSDSGRFYLEIPVLPEVMWPVTKTTYPPEARESQIATFVAEWADISDGQEGFHLIEHILLRPRSVDKELGYHVIPFTRIIQGWELAGSGGKFIAYDPLHGLSEGEIIVIHHEDWQLNGLDTVEVAVSNVTQDTFEIAVARMEKDGRPYYWIRKQQRRDPYSLQMTVMLPTWPRRFRDPAFRLLVEKTLRAEAPAHLKVYLQWMGPARMEEFEKCYVTWLETISQIPE